MYQAECPIHMLFDLDTEASMPTNTRVARCADQSVQRFEQTLKIIKVGLVLQARARVKLAWPKPWECKIARWNKEVLCNKRYMRFAVVRKSGEAIQVSAKIRCLRSRQSPRVVLALCSRATGCK